MKVLLVNKFYYLSGGAERYVFEWERLLREHGHEVITFSMRHPLNRPSAQERFFINRVSFDHELSYTQKLRSACHSIWSTEAGQRMSALLESEGPPDVAHVHSIVYQLTPAVLAPLRERGIPIVQTCHEYAHICVNQRLYDQRRNAICESCLRRGRLSPLWRRCIKGSFAASAAGCAAGLTDVFIGRSRDTIHRFFTPSAFMRRKMIEGGMPRRRVFHVPNFVNLDEIQSSDEPGEFILFLGRLVRQKGVLTFLEAAERVRHVPCRLVGGGPLETVVRRRVQERNLTNVQVLGHQDGEALWRQVRGARAVAAPSEWYEPFGLVILEGMAASRPIIATRIAGPAEIVSHGRDGILVSPGSAQELAAAFQTLWQSPDQARRMGRKGREKVESQYSADLHYRRLMHHYQEVIS